LEQNIACESAQNTRKLPKQALYYEENVNELADAGYLPTFYSRQIVKSSLGS
jgi:hypothetical protein